MPAKKSSKKPAKQKRVRNVATFTCPDHGTTPLAVICVHVAKSSKRVGFHHGRVTAANPSPTAWCDACERALAANDRRWNSALTAKAGWHFTCTKCFDDLRQRNQRS